MLLYLLIFELWCVAYFKNKKITTQIKVIKLVMKCVIILGYIFMAAPLTTKTKPESETVYVASCLFLFA